jgi:hypothetical protein
MVEKTSVLESGDVFIRNDLSREYNVESVIVANAGTDPVYYAAGTPMVDDAFATEAVLLANATVDGFVFEGIYVQPGGSKVAILRKPVGIVINEDAVPLVDPAGDALLLTSYRLNWTRLGYVFRSEPPTDVQSK